MHSERQLWRRRALSSAPLPVHAQVPKRRFAAAAGGPPGVQGRLLCRRYDLLRLRRLRREGRQASPRNQGGRRRRLEQQGPSHLLPLVRQCKLIT